MACKFTEFVKTEEKIKSSQTIYYLICIGLYFYLLLFFYYINTNNNQLNQQILKKINNTETNFSNEYIKITENNNINYLQQETLKKLTSIEHLMQQQLKIYYDIETNQMKVYENLPYIISRNVNDIREESILREKSQIIYRCETLFRKTKIYLNNKILSETINKEYYNKIKDISQFGFNNYKLHNTQFIIPLKKMLKTWIVTSKQEPGKVDIRSDPGVTSAPGPIKYTVETTPKFYTNCIVDMNDMGSIIWYGDIENKDDVHDNFEFQNIYNDK
jgi:hypothetical protein